MPENLANQSFRVEQWLIIKYISLSGHIGGKYHEYTGLNIDRFFIVVCDYFLFL